MINAYNQDFQPRLGGVFEPTHGFSLVKQRIKVNETSSFKSDFPISGNRASFRESPDKSLRRLAIQPNAVLAKPVKFRGLVRHNRMRSVQKATQPLKPED